MEKIKTSSTSERLKTLMKERNLRQVDILEKCKPYCEQYEVYITKSALSQYINGTIVPKQDKLYILGKALNVSEVWLMGYDAPMKKDNSAIVLAKIKKDKKVMELIEQIYELPTKDKETIISMVEVFINKYHN